jgi:NAD(P)-dependent dehydrogenase (short-subunit alcohol dehydrogenase family)
MDRLKDKVVLITGGSRGIGFSTAIRVAEQGGVPLIADRRVEEGQEALEALQKLSPNARFYELDVTDEDGWPFVCDAIDQEFGGLDGLVNNAGISAVGPISELTPKLWRRVIDVNLTGVYLGTHMTVPLLLSRGAKTKAGASIVNISSIMGLVSLAGASGYSASKGGVRLFTKGIALDFAAANQKIRANSIHPGFIVTPMHEEGLNRLAESGLAQTPDDVNEHLRSLTPSGRLGTPEDIANGALFLLSDESTFMNGSELVMDGGYTAQ